MYKKLLIILFFVFWAMPALGGVDTAWVREYSSPTEIPYKANALAVDNCGNVYVLGESYSEDTHYDYLTIKYSPDGDTAWVRRYDGPNSTRDFAYDVAADGLGNVYITGYSEGKETWVDFATIKYDTSGNLLWLRRYNGPEDSFDGARAMVVDALGCVFVTGKSVGSSTPARWDYATIKYYPNGDTAWVRRYSGSSYENEPNAIAVDGRGNIYVTGKSLRGGLNDYEYATVKYDSLGNELWAATYDVGEYYEDIAYAVVVDDSGHVYVTGQGWKADSGEAFTTIKYDDEGNELWVRRYRGTGNGLNEAYAIGMDDLGNVYVTGRSNDADLGIVYATVKYLPDGDTAWARVYCHSDDIPDISYALAVDDLGNIYVTGMDRTVKYDSDGNQLWVGDWGGVDIALDTLGDVYVTGWDAESDKYGFVTVKYVQTGTDIKDDIEENRQPSQFTLFQNYPNPFNQTTKIEFTLAKSGFVSLNIYDILGRKVRTLVSEHVSSGYKSVLWDGKNDSGDDVASGIYFYQLRVENPASGGVGDFSETRKLVLLK